MIEAIILIVTVIAAGAGVYFLFRPRYPDAYYASLEQIDQHDWCHAFAERCQEVMPSLSWDQAWTAACASYPTMGDEDPKESADIEMSYWD